MASVDIKINMITKEAVLQLQKLSTTARGTAADLGGVSRQAKGFGTNLSTSFRQASLAFGSFGTILRAGLIGGGLFGLVKGIKNTVDEVSALENALIGIGKVADIEGEELANLGRQFQTLGRRVPLATNELINLGEEAARLGVRGTANLLKFSETAARLAASTNVDGATAVTSLTRIINIAGESADVVDQLGASLVALGNNFATSEADILDGARVLSQRTAGFGLASKDILGISTALKEAGAPSESAASSIQSFFTIVTREAAIGGKRFSEFASIIGVTEEELKQKLATDAVGTLQAFIQGLDRSTKAGANLITTLDSVGLGEKRVSGSIRTLVSNVDRFNGALSLTNESFIKNEALIRESDRAFDTITGRTKLFNNAVSELFTNLGNSTLIKGTVSTFTTLVQVLDKAIGRIQSGNVTFAGGLTPLKLLADSYRDLTKAEFEALSPLEKLDVQIKTAKDSIDKLRTSQEAYIKTNTPVPKDVLNSLTNQIALIEKLEQRQAKLQQLELARQGAGKNKPDPDGNVERIQNREEANSKLLELDAQYFSLRAEQNALAEGATKEAAELAAQETLDANLIFAENARLQELTRLLEKETNAQKSIDIENRIAEETTRIKINQAKRESEIEKSKKQIEETTFRSRLAAAGGFFSTFASLQNSSNKTLATIGKAGAIGQITVNTAQAASNNYKFGSAIGGPALGGLFSALAIAAGAAQIAQVNAARFEQGGIVGGSSFTGDNVTARVNSGEMILNRQQQAQLFAQANGQSSSGGQQEVVVHTTVEIDGEAVTKAVSRQVANGAQLGSLI